MYPKILNHLQEHFLKDNFNIESNKSQFVKNKLESIKLKDIVTKSEILFNPQNNIQDRLIDEMQYILNL